MPTKILVVDDEPDMLEVCRDILNHLPSLRITTESDGRRAVQLLSSEAYDLVLLDLRMPEVDGMDLLKQARQMNPDALILLMTAYPTLETAVESAQWGAFDYLVKPFSLNQVLMTIRRAIEQKRLRDENRILRAQVERNYKGSDVVSQSEPMQEVLRFMQRVAPTAVDVLILGETGTGKELVARTLHRWSARKGHFIPVDCGAIPEPLLENELFGHEKGAYTGANSNSLGLIELAQEGTLFLDEIGDLPLSLQAKLLRVLQEHTFRRVGGQEFLSADIRVVAATHRDLNLEVQEKRFREDLYYRLNIVRLELPPLRERREDIPILTSFYVERYARELGKEVSGVDPEVMEVFQTYPWPGNVRELQNVLKRGILLAKTSTVALEDIPESILFKESFQSLSEGGGKSFWEEKERYVQEFEKRTLTELLKRYQGNVEEAASEAGIPRGTFYRLIKKHTLSPQDFR